MIFYIDHVQDNGNILLVKSNYVAGKYEMIKLQNGDIMLKCINQIVINSVEGLANYNFKHSHVLECSIINNSTFKSILESIYMKIGCGTSIIQFSSAPSGIKTIEKNDQGYKYMPDLGISVRGLDANNIIKEIFTQCINHSIEITLIITLLSNDIIRVTNVY
jgi:hypothetical protein